FRQAVDEGDLPPDADPELLARYLMTVANGIAVQAAGGTTRDELQQVADMALRSWPPA
ncbi:TetR/AcrR family transcriptional regulator, partial [Streptomyces mirabilis]